MRRTAALLTALGLLVHAHVALAQEPDELSLEVSPEVGTEDDTFVVTVKTAVPGISLPERFWPPDLSDFVLVDSEATNTTSMQVDPQLGRQIQAIEVRRYFVRPRRVGTFRVAGAKIRFNGREFESNAGRIVVRPSGSGSVATTQGAAPDPTAMGGVGAPGFRPPAAAKKNQDVFLHAVANKREMFVGEQVIVTWLLYARADVLKFEPRPPRLDGLWAETLYEPDDYLRYHRAEVGGEPFQVAIVSKRAIFPTVPGKVELQPFVAEVYTSYAPRGNELSSDSIALQVQELPEGAPPDFDETYVGSFDVEAGIDRSQLDAGESLMLTVTVRGEGAIHRTNPPEIEAEGFQFRRRKDFEEDVSPIRDVVRGERVYRYWVTPLRGGSQEIPPVTISYFDPRTQAYERTRSEELPLVVTGDPSAIDGDPGAKRENVIARDIRLNRDGTTISSVTVPRMYRSVWFWILAAIPMLGFVGVAVTDRVRERMRKDTPRSRLRRARGRARKRFKVADIHLRGNRPARFFGELVAGMYAFLEERLGQPVQSMTREELGAFLSEKGFAEPTIERIQSELETCDFARFAPSAAGPGEMRAAMRRVQDLLREIEKTRPQAAREDEDA